MCGVSLSASQSDSATNRSPLPSSVPGPLCLSCPRRLSCPLCLQVEPPHEMLYQLCLHAVKAGQLGVVRHMVRHHGVTPSVWEPQVRAVGRFSMA